MDTSHPPYRFSVAPMMDWTDRHCRYFHRLFSKNMLLYTEMVTAQALVYGNSDRFLRHAACEHPLALQLGGSDPNLLFHAVKIATPYEFCEINLNVGCPSDRVQSGRFGACLMREPELVAACVEAMQEAASSHNTEITVKCRIGVDDQSVDDTLPQFLDAVSAAGCKRFIIHARKAWLKGLSPKENRTIPPLDYELVYRMKQAYPGLRIVLNGGLEAWSTVYAALSCVDGVMVGRNAYHKPVHFLPNVDSNIFHFEKKFSQNIDPISVAYAMVPYIEQQLDAGVRINQITRHMLGLFAGGAGAKLWRKILSKGKSGTLEDYKYAVEAVEKSTAWKK